MVLSAIGRRYERLLFFAGPLALICLLVLFVAYSSEVQEDRFRAKCLRSIADLLISQKSELEKFREIEKRLSAERQKIERWSELRRVLIPWEVRNAACEKYIQKFEIGEKIPTADELIEKFQKEAVVLEGKPLSLYGVELPDRATISIFGTPIRMQLLTLVRVLQIALGPILLLWLGSLYNTRHRETLYIGQLRDIRGLYPHLINCYPVWIQGMENWGELRRRSWSKYFVHQYGEFAMYAVMRIVLLSIFIGPPVGCYVASLYFSGAGPFSPLFFAIGVVVGIFAFGNFLCEIFPWHAGRRFAVRSSTTI